MSRNDKSIYENIYDYIAKDLTFIKEVNDETQMSDNYIDNFLTEEQKIRDKEVTTLLKQYVLSYKNKVEDNKKYRIVLFSICITIVVAFSISFEVLFTSMDFSSKQENISNVIEVATACITFLTLIVGILKIITKYVFPHNDEEYITRIVEIIQKNDLENKKENIKIHDKHDEKIEVFSNEKDMQ